MALGNAVAGATHTPQVVTWTDEDGAVWSLVGATITGKMRPVRGGTARDIAGTMVLVGTGSTGKFTWTYAAADVVKGEYWVQFRATYSGGSYDLTIPTEFNVLDAL